MKVGGGLIGESRPFWICDRTSLFADEELSGTTSSSTGTTYALHNCTTKISKISIRLLSFVHKYKIKYNKIIIIKLFTESRSVKTTDGRFR